jgi:hypothetical protein
VPYRRGDAAVITHQDTSYWQRKKFRCQNLAIYPRVGQPDKKGRPMWGKTLGGYAARVEFRLKTQALASRGIHGACDVRRLDLREFIRRELRLGRLNWKLVENRHIEAVRKSPTSRRRFTLEEFVEGDVRRMPTQDAIDALKGCYWFRRDRCVKPVKIDWLIDRLIVWVQCLPPPTPTTHQHPGVRGG